jgi:hypothetical protein
MVMGKVEPNLNIGTVWLAKEPLDWAVHRDNLS